MPENIKGKDFISIHDFSFEEINLIFETTKLLKIEARAGIFRPILKDKNLAMIFQKPSTRQEFHLNCNESIRGESTFFKQL